LEHGTGPPSCQALQRGSGDSVESAIPNIQQALEETGELPQGFPSREAVALMELGHVEEKLTEVTAAVVAIRKLLYLRRRTTLGNEAPARIPMGSSDNICQREPTSAAPPSGNAIALPNS